MKITSTTLSKYKIFVAAACIFACLQLCFLSSANAQIDFYYGKNEKGFRLGGGPGVTALFTHYSSYPLSFAFVADVDYAFNPFFSLGVNAQYGTIVGQDNTNTFFVQKSSNTYYFYNLNAKAGVGLVSNFSPHNRFQDALKRFYVGLGYGNISNDVTLTASNTVAYTPTQDPNSDLTDKGKGKTIGNKKGQETLPIYTLDLGTYIDMPGLWGTDKVELCPNYQFNITTQPYLDGFKTPKENGFGIFVVTSLTLRFKF